MRGSDFIFNCFHLLYYECSEINLKQSYMNPPDWIKNKSSSTTTINPIHEKDKICFHYAITFTLNHEKIKRDSQRLTKLKPFNRKI